MQCRAASGSSVRTLPGGIAGAKHQVVAKERNRNPITMLSWFIDTIRPRTRAGANSAIYIGAKIKAAPTPQPPSMRAATSVKKLVTSADPTAVARLLLKMSADPTMTLLPRADSAKLPSKLSNCNDKSSALLIFLTAGSA